VKSVTKIRCQTSPQQRSNLARKAAQARWSRTNVGQAVSLSDIASPAIPAKRPSRTASRSKASSVDWLTTRFCLRLEQDSAGEWFLLTPTGLRLPASPAEIGLWLDIESLRLQLSNYESIIIG
jgi:hypothetical protein